MSDPEKFKKYLGKEKYYHDFLVFFQKEMEKNGWEDVLNRYFFAGTEEADDLLGRLFAGMFWSLYARKLTEMMEGSCIHLSTSDSELNSSNQPSSLKHWHKPVCTSLGRATSYSKQRQPPNGVGLSVTRQFPSSWMRSKPTQNSPMQRTGMIRTKFVTEFSSVLQKRC